MDLVHILSMNIYLNIQDISNKIELVSITVNVQSFGYKICYFIDKLLCEIPNNFVP